MGNATASRKLHFAIQQQVPPPPGRIGYVDLQRVVAVGQGQCVKRAVSTLVALDVLHWQGARRRRAVAQGPCTLQHVLDEGFCAPCLSARSRPTRSWSLEVGQSPQRRKLLGFARDAKALLGTKHDASAMGILRRRADLLLAQLDEREIEFVFLVASGHSQAEIADILGFANADVVKPTLNRKRNHLKAIAEEAGLDPTGRHDPAPTSRGD